MNTEIYVVGYVKVGATWLSRLLGDVLDSPVGAIHAPSTYGEIATEGQGRPGPFRVGHGHPSPIHKRDAPVSTRFPEINIDALSDEHIILMNRDPRDVAVSAQHHWKMESLDVAIDAMLVGKWPMPHGGGYQKFYEAWDRVDFKYGRIDYAVLLSDTERATRDILLGMGLHRVGMHIKIKDAVKRQSFAARKKWTAEHGDSLNYGKDWQLNFLRKGIVGDWKNHFTEEQLERIEPLYEYYKSVWE